MNFETAIPLWRIMDAPAIVIDNGAGFMKVGYGGDLLPSAIFPTVIQYPARTPSNAHTDEWKSIYNIGHSVNPDPPHASLHRLRHPLSACGFIQNWEEMETIWKYALAEIGASLPLSHPIIMTEAAYVPPSQRLRQAACVFESFSAPAYYSAPPALLSAYAANTPTALVLDSGHTATFIVPIYEFTAIRQRARSHDVSGQAVDDWLRRALADEAGVELPSNGAWEDATSILKFQRCRVARDFEAEVLEWVNLGEGEGGRDKVWELPDGRRVKLARPLGLLAGEIPFMPGILGLDVGGVQYDVFRAIMQCDKSLRECFYGNILLAGGNTMLPGFGARLKRDVEGIAGAGTKANVISPRNRAYSAWVGGSMLSELSTFRSMSVSREEYNETGPEIVNRKCF